MAQIEENHTGVFQRGTVNSRRSPWALVALAIVVLMSVGYSIDSDRSLSEREGVVTQTEAENDVIPSLPPERNVVASVCRGRREGALLRLRA